MEWLDPFYRLIGEAEGDIGWAEMTVRALIVFAYGILLTRIGGWRAFGKWSPPDIIVAVVVGSNLSRALTGPAPLVPTLVATTALFAAYWALSFASSRSDLVDRLVKGTARRLVSDGKLDRPAMAATAVSRRDVDEALRERGVAELAEVESAHLERSGKISVVRRG